MGDVVEVDKPERVAHEKHRCVVANQIPVASFSVELECEPTHVALGIRTRLFAVCKGKPRNHRRLFANLGKNASSSVFGNILCHSERAKRTTAFCVHSPFRHKLAVEVRQLFHKPNIRKHVPPIRSSRERIGIVLHRSSRRGSENIFFIFGIFHIFLLFDRLWTKQRGFIRRDPMDGQSL